MKKEPKLVFFFQNENDLIPQTKGLHAAVRRWPKAVILDQFKKELDEEHRAMNEGRPRREEG